MNSLVLNHLNFIGTQINYYLTCKRELWFFSKGLIMEQNSDLVLQGKILHNDSYKRNKKEFMIDNNIVIDFIEKDGVINEIKKSNKMEQAHIFQMLYYLYYLKQKGLENLKGVINYPLLKQKISVELDEQKTKELRHILTEIDEIIKIDIPPKIQKQKFCKSCSYYEFCWC